MLESDSSSASLVARDFDRLVVLPVLLAGAFSSASRDAVVAGLAVEGFAAVALELAGFDAAGFFVTGDLDAGDLDALDFDSLAVGFSDLDDGFLARVDAGFAGVDLVEVFAVDSRLVSCDSALVSGCPVVLTGFFAEASGFFSPVRAVLFSAAAFGSLFASRGVSVPDAGLAADELLAEGDFATDGFEGDDLPSVDLDSPVFPGAFSEVLVVSVGGAEPFFVLRPASAAMIPTDAASNNPQTERVIPKRFMIELLSEMGWCKNVNCQGVH